MGQEALTSSDGLNPAGLLQQVSHGLILDLAMGWDDPRDTLVRHGFTPEQAARLLTVDALHQAVLRKKSDMDREGLTHQFRAISAADKALMYLCTKLDPEMPTGQLLEIYRELKKSGKMDQVEIGQNANLPSFQIVINTGKSSVSLTSQTSNALEQNVIDATPLPVIDLPSGNLSDLVALVNDD